MNDIYNRDFMLNIGPSGISLIAVNSADRDLALHDSFNIKIDMKKSMEGSFNHFYKHLMERISQELVYKVLEGEIYNGDLLRLFPTNEGKDVLIKVSVFRHCNISKKICASIENLNEVTKTSIETKEDEIEDLRGQLNIALEHKDYNLCKDIVQKINYIKDEFLI